MSGVSRAVTAYHTIMANKCTDGCPCGKHTVRNSGQFKLGEQRQLGYVHTEETRAKIRTARARQTNVVGNTRTPIEPMKRFLSKVVSGDGTCIEWTGALDPKGYGAFGLGSSRDGTRRTVRAHRFAYESVYGQVPEGLELDHLCNNRKCVNPDHLEAVTHRENIQRARRRRMAA